MIRGVVSPRHAATIPLPVEATDGRPQVIEATIDTGFSGSLTLPADTIQRFGLPWRTRGSALLANGTVDFFDIYAATVLWDGTPRTILVEQADVEPLVGVGLLLGHRLTVDVVAGGTVTIEPVS